MAAPLAHLDMARQSKDTFAHLDMATQYKDKVEVGMAADSYKLALLSAPF